MECISSLEKKKKQPSKMEEGKKWFCTVDWRRITLYKGNLGIVNKSVTLVRTVRPGMD